MPLIQGSKSKILAKGRAKGGPLHSLDDQEWMKELKGGGFTRKCIAYIMDVSTEWLRYMERKYGLMVDRDSRYANRKEAIARKRIAWEKAQKELVAAKSSLFEEALEEPAEAIPPGFTDLVDWLTPLGGVADPDELSIHINGLQVLFAGLRSHSSHNNGIRKGDLRRWTERYPKFLLIYEDEWASPVKRPLIKNMILIRTGLAKDLVKLNARDLEPRFLIKKDYQHFLTHHHLEGKVQDRRTKFAIGLFDQSGGLREWIEEYAPIQGHDFRYIRGSEYANSTYGANDRLDVASEGLRTVSTGSLAGIRIASIVPAPSTTAMVWASGVCLAVKKRRRR